MFMKKRSKNLALSLVLCSMILTSMGISNASPSTSKKETEQNPYVQAYINEKNMNSDSTRTAPIGQTAWDGNFKNYSTGDVVLYNGNTYTCLQSHTSLQTWNPIDATSLWTLKSQDSLVDQQIEEKIIISTLQEYYAEDLKVANVLKKFTDDTELYKKTLSTKKEDKIEAMKAIKSIYNNSNKEEQELLKRYLLKYAKNANDSEIISFFNEISKPVTSGSLRSYNSWGAADWAYNNYNATTSANFPYFNSSIWGSDCTNFVSQAMNVGGGYSMTGTWYCYKKNSSYPVPANATQLDYSWQLANPSPWISVNEFFNFWYNRVSTFSYSKDNYIANHSTIFRNSGLSAGNVIILHKGIWNWATVPTHAMIVSRYSYGTEDYLLAGHSNPRQAHPLLTAIQDYCGVDFFRF